MLLIAWPVAPARLCTTWPVLVLLCLSVSLRGVQGINPGLLKSLRDDTRDLFYHGYDNYLEHAYPEDELKPLSCGPQTRNRHDPGDIGLNDVLGNYSVTLVDSLSTLAILASDDDPKNARKSLVNFQSAVKNLVSLYGDGTEEGRCGSKACGFDLDSKVQVFETNIRGVGGLLSAHLFAAGELPIRNYKPRWIERKDERPYIQWYGFRYNGQLLRLAHDLAERLLPAFNTKTGLPYPRVNLRHGIPFYEIAGTGFCRLDGTTTDGPREITETCSAGAGSLVLEFTTLSRLTGDMRFEKLAKRAFYAVWEKRSALGLIGGGIDAESGEWIVPALAGIGAGVDSFFEYAVKSHVLLSGLPYDEKTKRYSDPDRFWTTWQIAHEAVKRHVYRSASTERHAFYGQSDQISGAPRYNWIDNLSAYYPGLLVLAGELEEAIESHLLWAALWTRYSALPERWQTSNSFIDPNFKHWAGRPEFIESTYYIYQATKDPWYLHVGEMTLRDIRRRCWTKCGWADLGDVMTGEQRDRMESFFLGETAKYLYLLFSEDHPLNKLDGPLVFTTEGHPLMIPKAARSAPVPGAAKTKRDFDTGPSYETRICPMPPAALPLTVSNVVNRTDFFHAAALARLHLTPVNPARSSPLLEKGKDTPGISMADLRSPTNYTYYPWTLPAYLIPAMAISTPLRSPILSTLSFPDLTSEGANIIQKGLVQLGAVQKVAEGVLVKSLSNLRLNMVQEARSLVLPDESGALIEADGGAEYRIHGIANWPLGRDEKVLLSPDALQDVSPADPHFTLMKDLEMVDLLLDAPPSPDEDTVVEYDTQAVANDTLDALWDELKSLLPSLLPQMKRVQSDQRATTELFERYTMAAILPTGVGAAPLPPMMEKDLSMTSLGQLPFRSIFFLDAQLCHDRLPDAIVRTYNILVIRRGGCSFSDKLVNIPSFPPSRTSLQLVVVMSIADAGQDQATYGSDGGLIRPLLDKRQTTPNGLERRNPLSIVMIDGAGHNYELLRRAASAIGAFDSRGKLVEQRVRGPQKTGDSTIAPPSAGLGVKRRYWFESQGVRIANLVML